MDEITVDGFFNVIHCSLQYMLENTDVSKASQDVLFEAKLELQVKYFHILFHLKPHTPSLSPPPLSLSLSLSLSFSLSLFLSLFLLSSSSLPPPPPPPPPHHSSLLIANAYTYK